MDQSRSRAWDLFMITSLLGSIGLVFWYEAVSPARTALRTTIEWVDLGLVVFFVLEWAWRVKSAPEKKTTYMLRNSWELLGMIPLILPVPAFLRALRFLRIVRILRAFKVIGRSLRFWERLARDPNLKKVGISAVVITVGGALLVWALEKDTNSDLAAFSEAIWWAVVTVTTVGYGDITPNTTMGRFVAAILMITGIGVIGTLASSMASILLDERREDDLEDALMEHAPSSVAGQLVKLAELHEDDHLSDDEYTAAKQKVIERA